MEKTCRLCNHTKNIFEFGSLAKNKDGFQSYCKECGRIQWKGYYNRNKEKYRDRITRNNRAWLFRVRPRIKECKQGKSCLICGEREPVCLDFHHLKDKEFNIADMVSKKLSWVKIVKEMEKCVVICANCHRKLHAGLLELIPCVAEKALFKVCDEV